MVDVCGEGFMNLFYKTLKINIVSSGRLEVYSATPRRRRSAKARSRVRPVVREERLAPYPYPANNGFRSSSWTGRQSDTVRVEKMDGVTFVLELPRNPSHAV